jgi:NitT/TauT family transport system permease protein
MPTPEIKIKDAPPAGHSAGMRIGAWGFALPLACLALWYLVTGLKLVQPLLVPSPTATFKRLVALFLRENLTSDIGATAWRWGCGYVLGCLIGVPFGLFIGNSRRVYAATYPTLDFFRSLPVTALFPLFLVLFGIGDNAKIAMAFTAALFVVILNCAYGALQAKETRLRAARVFGASEGQVFRWVVFFEALPQTLAGMRTALSLCLVVVIVSEMFTGTTLGLGERVYNAYTVNDTEMLYAVLVLIGLLGYLINRGFVWAETRIVFWTGK